MRFLKLRKRVQHLVIGLVLGAAMSSVSAVQLNPDGLGQALIFPYYNVQIGEDGGTYNSMFSVVNYSGDAKAVRINIREGRQGKVVLFFDVFLMRNDTWTAVIYPDESDSQNAKILTRDETCTNPTAWDSSGVPFRDYDEGASVGNVEKNYREGYIEVIEMATIPPNTELYGVLTREDCYPFEANESLVKEGATGANTGGLSGHMTLINVQPGFGFNVKAMALDDFSERGKALGYEELAKGATVNLTSAYPESVVPGNGEELLLISKWEAGTADAVRAVLTRHAFKNEYVRGGTTSSQTAWVATFPLRYLDKPAESYYGYGMASYNREGKPYFCMGGFLMDGCGAQLYWAANVLNFGEESQRNLFFSRNQDEHNSGFFQSWFYQSTSSGLGSEGMASFAPKMVLPSLSNNTTKVITRNGEVLEGQSRKYQGLPVIGFSAYTFTNATIALPDGKIGRSIYGVTEPHSYQTWIE